eukprot:scpid21305/ scgid30204/ 
MRLRSPAALLLLLTIAVTVRRAYTTDNIKINEVNSHQPGEDTSEYIELKVSGGARVDTSNATSTTPEAANTSNTTLSALYALDNYVIVLYDGRTGLSYRSISLNGYRTNGSYFVIGMTEVIPSPDLIIEGTFLQNGDQRDNPDAVALYLGTAEEFPVGTQAHSRRLVDAVVYNKFSPRGNPFLENTLSPLNGIVHEVDAYVSGALVDLAISRCPSSSVPFESLILTLPTPGYENNCTAHNPAGANDVPCPGFPSDTNMQNPLTPPVVESSIVINELSADSPQLDTEEFVELYDGGRGNTSLSGITIVFFDGSWSDNRAYSAIDLSAYRTNFEGYFVIGSEQVFPTPDLVVCDHFIGNGPDAVALHSTLLPNSSEPSAWTNESVPTRSGLLDAIVYSRGREVDSELLSVLLPGQRQLQERDLVRRSSNIEVSLSRCESLRRLHQDAFQVTTITPGSQNNCTRSGTQSPPLLGTLVLSEVLPGSSISYIEISDGGVGLILLSGVSLKIRVDDTIFVVDLSQYNTDLAGFLTVGSYPDADVVTAPMSFGSSGSIQVLQNGVSLDEVQYRTTANGNRAHLYAPAGFSLSRCFGIEIAVQYQGAFVSSQRTPREPNLCGNVSINEVNAIPSTSSLVSSQFIELFNDKGNEIPLAQYTLVITDKQGRTLKEYPLLNFTTSSSGFFSLATRAVLGNSALIESFDPLSARLIILKRYPMDVPVSIFTIAQSDTGREVNSIVDMSVSTCSNYFNGNVRTVLARPTAGLPNDCGSKVNYPTPSNMLINEIDANQRGPIDAAEYIELRGEPNSPLNDLQLVIYQGLPTPTISAAYTLEGYTTNSNGLFVLGAEGCRCSRDMQLLSNLPDRTSGIAIYQVPPSWITLSAQAALPPSEYLVDAVVYHARRLIQQQPEQLLDLLLPCQELIVERTRFSLSRCHSSQPRNTLAFVNTGTTPGAPNICPAASPLPSTTTNVPCTRIPTAAPTTYHTSYVDTTGTTVTPTVTNSRNTEMATPSQSQHRAQSESGGISSGVVVAMVLTCAGVALLALILRLLWAKLKQSPCPSRGLGQAPRQISVHPFDIAPLPPTGADGGDVAFMKLEEPLSGRSESNGEILDYDTNEKVRSDTFFGNA